MSAADVSDASSENLKVLPPGSSLPQVCVTLRSPCTFRNMICEGGFRPAVKGADAVIRMRAQHAQDVVMLH